jgi:hypothetical protein
VQWGDAQTCCSDAREAHPGNAGEYQASITPENWKRELEQRGIALDGKPIEGATAG